MQSPLATKTVDSSEKILKYKTNGVIQLYSDHKSPCKGVRININSEICEYYRRLFIYSTFNTINCQIPLYRAHVSVVLPKIHRVKNLNSIQQFHNQKVAIWYNPEDFVVTSKNIWLKVQCPIGDTIKEKLQIEEPNFWGYHIVVGNFKFESNE